MGDRGWRQGLAGRGQERLRRLQGLCAASAELRACEAVHACMPLPVTKCTCLSPPLRWCALPDGANAALDTVRGCHLSSSCTCPCCRQRRRDELISLQQQIGESFAESLVGQEVDVIIDGYNDDGWLVGRTQVSAGPGLASGGSA